MHATTPSIAHNTTPLRTIIVVEHFCTTQSQNLCQSDIIYQDLLPEIRTTALLIAASRHDFTQRSPQRFSDPADWLAAQILVLNAKIAHIPEQKIPLLNLANQRAQQFAQQHQLAFETTKSKNLTLSLPNNTTMFSCLLMKTRENNPIANTLSLRKNILKPFKTI